MQPAARISDSCAGSIVTGASSVIVEGSPLAHIGSKVSPHPFGDHVHIAEIVTGSSSVFVEGKPVARINDLASCNHSITTGASSVTVGG